MRRGTPPWLGSTGVKATQISNALPTSDDHDFATSFPAYASAMTGFGERLNGLLQGFMDQQQPAASERYRTVDDDADRFEMIVDLSDRLLERVVDATRRAGDLKPTKCFASCSPNVKLRALAVCCCFDKEIFSDVCAHHSTVGIELDGYEYRGRSSGGGGVRK